MSTGPPALARRLAERFESALDSPVSGGPRGAESATLTIMVGGRAEDFARAEPVLEALGRPVHVGGPGAGQAAKLCNNLIAGVTMAAIAEACALATAEGLDPATLYDLLTTSTGDSRVLRTRFPLEGADPAHPVAIGLRSALRARPDREGPRARGGAGGGAGCLRAARGGRARRLPRRAGGGARAPRLLGGVSVYGARALTSAVTVSLTGAATPTSRPTRGIAPLMKSISSRRPASKSSSIDGFAPGIFEPKSRT